MLVAKNKRTGHLYPHSWLGTNNDLVEFEVPDGESVEKKAAPTKKKAAKKSKAPSTPKTMVSEEPIDLDDIDVSDL